jgi:hypothetical protein
LLAVQTLEIRADRGKLIIAEIMLAVTVVVGAIAQLVLSKSFGALQLFLGLLLLGGILVIVEALRTYADL